MKVLLKHKKLILLLTIVISVFLIYKYNNKNNISYISIGDGYSKGIDSYGRISYGYSDYLKDYLKENNKLNDYTKSFTNKNASIESLYADIVINKKAKSNNKEINIKQTLRESKVLTISIGMNDLIYRLSTTENIDENKLDIIIKDIDKSLDKLINEIKKYYQKDIYIIGYYKSNTNNYYLLKGIDELNNLYKNKNDVIYIYSEKLKNNPNKYFSNPTNFYPNNAGYKEISKEIELKISKKLEKK